MGCFQSTPAAPLDTLSDEARRKADEERAQYEAERKEKLRLDAERRAKEEEDKKRAAVELENVRVEEERAKAERERKAKEAADVEAYREMKWKEEQLRRREEELKRREEEDAKKRPKSPRAASPRAASPPPDSPSSVAPDADDDRAEYRRAIAADVDREKTAENVDLRAIRATITETFTYWGTTKGAKTLNLLREPDATPAPPNANAAAAQSPGANGNGPDGAAKPPPPAWTVEEGPGWVPIGLPVGGGIPDLPALCYAWVGTDRGARSQKLDLLRCGVPAHVLASCPRIELHSYHTASAPNAVKVKVVCTVSDERGATIDEFVAKRTAPSGGAWGEFYHAFKAGATGSTTERYNRAPRFVEFKEFARNKILRSDAAIAAAEEYAKKAAAAAAAAAVARGEDPATAKPPPITYQIAGSSVVVYLP